MAVSGFDGLTSMPGYDLKSDFGFNGCLRLQCLTSMSATSYNVASASMADCGFDGLTSMPGYKLKSDLDFNGWLRLQWLGFNAWLRCGKWLRLQWLAAATMAWLATMPGYDLQSDCLATSRKMA